MCNKNFDVKSMPEFKDVQEYITDADGYDAYIYAKIKKWLYKIDALDPNAALQIKISIQPIVTMYEVWTCKDGVLITYSTNLLEVEHFLYTYWKALKVLKGVIE